MKSLSTQQDMGLTVPYLPYPSPVAELGRRGNPFATNAAHLAGQMEQLAFLINRGLLPGTFWAVVGSYIEMFDFFPDDRAAYFILTEEWFQKIGGYLNSAIYIPPPLPASHPALTAAINPGLDLAGLEARFLASEPQLVVVDDFLSPPALQALLDFCLEATVFFDARFGYASASLDEGLGRSQVLLALVAELRHDLPMVVGDRPLAGAWAFKYDSEVAKGTEVHADQAAVSLNFWITPDGANLDESSGGLVVYDKPPPKDWAFTEYNGDDPAIRRRKVEHLAGCEKVVVPYKQNRLVMFHSKLFHKTDSFRFKRGFENRRINLTLLFGDNP